MRMKPRFQIYRRYPTTTLRIEQKHMAAISEQYARRIIRVRNIPHMMGFM